MKKILLLAFLFCQFAAIAQQTPKTEEDEILRNVQLFFQSLEKQDTALYRNLFLPESVGWAVWVAEDSLKRRHWRSVDRVQGLINPSRVIEEKILSYEIKVHQQIAVAWVPYTLSISGKFSHCGVDIFNFIKTDEGWKINSISFTMEPNGCDALKK